MNEPDKEMSQREAPQRRALLLDPDLFFAVKVSATLKHLGFETTTARQLADWNRRLQGERFDIALVNTAARGVEWEQAIGAARAAGLPVIAYGSHVDTEAQAQARAAGATRVIANSKLAADLPTIVEQTLQRARASAERVTNGDDA
jgi:DNA-binding NtrC family response regulator